MCSRYFLIKKKLFLQFLLLILLLNYVGINQLLYAEELEVTSEELKKEENAKTLKGYVSKIPSGTKLSIILEVPIDEITSMIGDEVTARISKDIIIDNESIVPAGSTVIGVISEVNPARRMHKAGNIKIEFKNLTISDGRQIPIVATVLTRSGLIKGKLTKKAALISGATLVAPAAAGFGAGLAAEGSPVGGLIGAAVGAVAGIALFAFQKGNKVDIKAGDEMEIELVEEALLPSVVVSGNEGGSIEEVGLDKEPQASDEKVTEIDFTEGEAIDNQENKNLFHESDTKNIEQNEENINGKSK